VVSGPLLLYAGSTEHIRTVFAKDSSDSFHLVRKYRAEITELRVNIFKNVSVKFVRKFTVQKMLSRKSLGILHKSL